MIEDFHEELGVLAEDEDKALYRGKALSWDIIATFSLDDAMDYFKKKKDRGMVNFNYLIARYVISYIINIISTDRWK